MARLGRWQGWVDGTHQVTSISWLNNRLTPNGWSSWMNIPFIVIFNEISAVVNEISAVVNEISAVVC